MNQLDFKGRTAVVTGGMQGIGAAIVKRLEASGAKVAVYEVDDAETARKLTARGVDLIETFAIGELRAALGG